MWSRKEELGERERERFRMTKIWQDYSTLLKLKRGVERVFLCALEWRRRGVYIVVVEKIWMEENLIRVDKGLKRIMNLNPLSVFRES